MGFWKRVGATASDPWLGLASGFIGAAGWAAHVVSAPPAALIAGGAFAVGALMGGLVNRGKEPDAWSEEPALPELVGNTRQAGMVADLRHYLEELRTIRSGHIPDAVVDLSIEALVGAENALRTATRVAAAVDGLDRALSRSDGSSTNAEVRASVKRMADRRDALLAKLEATSNEVAVVYTKLLEMTATMDSFDLGGGGSDDIARVSSTLDSLRTNLTELEAQARNPA